LVACVEQIAYPPFIQKVAQIGLFYCRAQDASFYPRFYQENGQRQKNSISLPGQIE